MEFADTLYGTVKNGVLVLSGYVASVTTEHGQLVIKDGVKGNVVERTYSRAHCPISRLISTQSEGYISFSAIRWLQAIGASFIHLNYDGTPLVTSAPHPAVMPAGLRRRQALLSAADPLGAAIVWRFLASKITGQIRLLEHLDMNEPAAAAWAYAGQFLQSSAATFDLGDALGVEGIVALGYWNALADVPISFGRRQNVPMHWRSFSARRSVLTGEPRGAVAPAQAMLNYLYGVLASEITIALHARGLDPVLGIMHADKDDRASLAYDLIEPARPILDRWFVRWLTAATFSKRDFIEDGRGWVRIMRPLSSHLAMTAALWRGIADQLAGWFYRALETGQVPPLALPAGDIEIHAGRRAVRWSLGNNLQGAIPRTCRECGKALSTRRRKFCSAECMLAWHGGAPVKAGLLAIEEARRRRAKTGEQPRAKVFADRGMSIREWQAQPEWSVDRDNEMRAWFAASVVPALAQLRPSDIKRATGLSKSHSIKVKHGAIPHPRLMLLLSELAGVEYPFPI